MNSDQQYFCEYFPQGERKTITHMCFAAHFDDIEFMAYHGILQCFGRSDRWFGGVVMTDGAGSPRTGIYADYNDDQMKKIRLQAGWAKTEKVKAPKASKAPKSSGAVRSIRRR